MQNPTNHLRSPGSYVQADSWCKSNCHLYIVLLFLNLVLCQVGWGFQNPARAPEFNSGKATYSQMALAKFESKSKGRLSCNHRGTRPCTFYIMHFISRSTFITLLLYVELGAADSTSTNVLVYYSTRMGSRFVEPVRTTTRTLSDHFYATKYVTPKSAPTTTLTRTTTGTTYTASHRFPSVLSCF